MKYPVTILFDLDGTLLDTISDLRDSLNIILKAHNLPCHDTDAVKRFVGNGLTKLIERAIPNGLMHPEFHRIEAEMRIHYAKHCNEQTAPYRGIIPLLSALHEDGCAIGVVSNKPDAQVKALCKTYFPETVSIAIGQSDTVSPKPAPDSVLTAMKQLGADAENTLYIGDSEVDIQTAQNVGIPCISVLWGFRTKDFLLAHGAQSFAQTPEDLLAMIRKADKSS